MSNTYIFIHTIVCKSFDGKKVSWFGQTLKIKHMKFFHMDY